MIVEVEAGVYSVLIDGESYEVYVSGNEYEIHGQRFLVEIEDPRRWKRGGNSSLAAACGTLRASMPGKIVRLLAAVGDEIEAGQGVLVMEAMKMQNELKAPRAGRLISLHVNVNDSVTAGAVLAVVE